MSSPAGIDDPDILCVGVCMNDPDSGYCLGCGRPPLASSEEQARAAGPSSHPPLSSPADELTAAADRARA